MVHEILTNLIKKHFFIVSFERFKNENTAAYLERYVAKHPLLKPEMIVVNDQIHGFKKISKRHASLEKCPIFIDVEYSEDESGNRFVDNFDLYAETRVKNKERLTDLMHLGHIYEKYIYLDRVKRLQEPTYQAFLIYSKLNDIFLEEYFEHDLEEELMTPEELTSMIGVHFTSFLYFIRVLDDVLTKGKLLSSLNLEVFE